ncbi:hypothetical protein MN116_002852 [Schistosoma mekongi]|uniref:Centrosomal protein of 76 kDa n=1 Tax=Schistosoma mekongi TaxID=38744 RepID=A0AAE1ZH35_SCHME|nr:hypothetical protein MN116_002852 [Schistosoma mekongi]
MADWHSLIDEALSDEEIVNEIKSSIRITNYNPSSVSKSQLLEILRSKGVIDTLISKIKSKERSTISQNIHNGLLATFEDINTYILRNMNASLVLVVEILKGRAFTSHLQTYEDVHDDEFNCPNVSFQLHIAYKDHRFSSKVFQCTAEPVINQYFCFEIISNYTNKENDTIFEKLLVDKPVSLVQIVIISTSLVTGRRSLIASTYFDWRPYFLGSSKCNEVNSNHWTTNASIELKSTDPNCNVSAGILDLRLSLICTKKSVNTNLSHPLDQPINSNMSGVINCQPSKLKHLSPSLVQAHFHLESIRSNERENSFTNYVRQWWRELTQLREGFFSNRLIKIFATDENGNTQFVCNFVNPLSVSHILETPYTAARFVSSIPYEPFCSIGNEIKERWYSGLAFVSSNCGDIADHANLLCSLLLGYGLEAYVALGTGQFNMNKQLMTTSSYLCAWVVVCSDDYHRITFWDCITGHRYIHTISCCEQNLYSSPFYSVGCLYNDNSFYANIQPTDKVVNCSFNLKVGSDHQPIQMSMYDVYSLFLNSSDILLYYLQIKYLLNRISVGIFHSWFQELVIVFRHMVLNKMSIIISIISAARSWYLILSNIITIRRLCTLVQSIKFLQTWISFT